MPDFVAPCLFGLEGLVAGELRDMEAADVTAENGRVWFSGGPEMVARANIGSRFAERILMVVGGFHAASFEELFEGVKRLPWTDYLGENDSFPVKGWSRNSALHSIPDCQSIIKKAVVERMKSRYGRERFAETGPVHQIQFSLMHDTATLMIDTSGDGLHKRGYRPQATVAPLKETLAAAMAYLARLYPDSHVYDPFCGSGTLLIESTLLACHIAPGLRRSFAAERFDMVPSRVWREERERARALVQTPEDFTAEGSDIDEQAVALTMENAGRAGVAKYVTAVRRDIADFTLLGARGVVITNPPYGERMLDVRAAENIYRVMGRVFSRTPGWKYSVLSPHTGFEDFFGRPADRRRKLYNGMISCQDYMYYK